MNHILTRCRRHLRHAIFVPGTAAQIHARIPLLNVLTVLSIIGTILLVAISLVRDLQLSMPLLGAPLIIVLLLRGLAWIGDSDEQASPHDREYR